LLTPSTRSLSRDRPAIGSLLLYDCSIDLFSSWFLLFIGSAHFLKAVLFYRCLTFFPSVPAPSADRCPPLSLFRPSPAPFSEFSHGLFSNHTVFPASTVSPLCPHLFPFSCNKRGVRCPPLVFFFPTLLSSRRVWIFNLPPVGFTLLGGVEGIFSFRFPFEPCSIPHPPPVYV